MMDEKVYNQLEEAREHFRSWRLQSAYQIFRRYYDRLPFRPEEGHAEFIGMFARTLLELGKIFELKFYLKELERAYETSKSPYIGYALGVVYVFSPERRLEAAREVFESVLKRADDDTLKAKAKIMLAYYYDTAKRDVGACRMLIDSIPEPKDPDLRSIWRTWKAKVLMEEGKLDEAEAAYLSLIGTLDEEKEWYPYVISTLNLGWIYLKRGDAERARDSLDRLRKQFDNRQFKSLATQLDEFEEAIREKSGQGVIFCTVGSDKSVLQYESKSLVLKRRSPAERLLCLLAAKKLIDKRHIVQALYDREYVGEADDKLIYYHIHCLRKRLRELGAEEAIEMAAGGYRLIPRIENRKADEC